MPQPSLISPQNYAAALDAYRKLNDSPMQRKLRQNREMFIAAVYWWPGDYDRKELLREFRRIREVGFTTVRMHTHRPTEVSPGVYDFTHSDVWLDTAAEAGLSLIMHLDGHAPSEAVLAKCGMTAQQFEASFLERETEREPIEMCYRPILERYRKHPAVCLWPAYGEPHSAGREMTDSEMQAFGEWLRKRYGTIGNLDRTWNIYPGRKLVESFETAWTLVADFAQSPLIAYMPKNRECYGPARDLMRFQTDRAIARARATVDVIRKYDPDHPVAIGTHQLFLNQPMLRWDVGQWARLGDLFFTSIHLSWHFDAVKGEVDRPVHMQSRLTADMFKGGWASAYETTGGAVQYSGGYGNSMSPGLMRRLMCSYLAAGNKSIAFWTWNHRPGGWEGGEYGLTTLSGEVSSWAKEAGVVSRAMLKYRDEIWEAEHEPRVGLLQSWDTQAVYMLEPDLAGLKMGPSQFVNGTKAQPHRAYIGAARAMINEKVAFEYVTEQEILEGIALRYPTIYAPHLRAASKELLEKLREYVEKGGRLIGDVQFGFTDPWGKLQPTGKGKLVERIFGAWIDTIHDARTEAKRLNGIEIRGHFGDIATTTARVLATFDDGRPAITEARIGKGTAVLVGFDAGMMCSEPGQADVEALVASLAMGNAPRDWECNCAMAFRLTTPAADHYFLLNEGDARSCIIKSFDHAYSAGSYVIEDRPIPVDGTIAVQMPARSGTWVRLEKRSTGKS